MRKKHPPVRSIEECVIKSLSQEGLGKNEDVSVPFVLPGETVRVERFVKNPGTRREQPKFFLQEVLNPSSNRVVPKCVHFTQCGGCLLQHLNDFSYAEFKKSLIVQPFIKYQIDASLVRDVQLLPAGERRRANFEICKKPDGVVLGFHKWQSHTITNLTECHTVDPKIAALFQPLREVCEQIMRLYQKASVYVTVTEVGIDMNLDVHSDDLAENAESLLVKFASRLELARLVLRVNRKRNTIFSTADPFVMMDGVPVAIEASSFLQASERADRMLTEIAVESIGSAYKIADLFCGRGTFTFPLSRIAPVDGYECDKPALAALNAAAEKSGRPIQTFCRNLFDEPLSALELKNYDVVVIDPPRAGCAAQTEQLALNKNVKKIIYVSCGPESFARDIARLTQSGYVLEKVVPVDQFTWAPHLEVIGVLTRC
jgi:23S rRNA (uracil1939-C5)-methyltransferase